MSDWQIECDHVSYSYPISEQKKPALADINVKLEKGKFYGVIGANGAGKTTFCAVLRGFIPSFYKGSLVGTVQIDGQEIDQLDAKISKKIGFIFQNPFSQLSGVKDTVFEEVAFGLENFGINALEIEKRVSEIMRLCDIEKLALKNPFELSGGQVQRVAFASILVLNPEILIIDEPTSQLDPEAAEMIYKIISHLKDTNKTIILVDHRTDLIAEYADEVLLFDHGKLIIKDSPDKVLADDSIENRGIKLPAATKLFYELQKRGINLSKIPTTIGEANDLIRKAKVDRSDGCGTEQR